jgi:hypothetical protein
MVRAIGALHIRNAVDKPDKGRRTAQLTAKRSQTPAEVDYLRVNRMAEVIFKRGPRAGAVVRTIVRKSGARERIRTSTPFGTRS